MASQSRARAGAAAVGLLLLLIGIAGGAALSVLSVQRPGQAVDGFGRAPIGCTTTLEFTETGTFYVFEERGPSVVVPDGGCQPVADPVRPFGFELRGPDGPMAAPAEMSLGYDTHGYSGTSVARVEIVAAGRYEIVVVGDDPQVVAAIGRDPDDGVTELRQLAIIVAAVGVLFGALLVLLSRRSRPVDGVALPEPSVWASDADRLGTQGIAPDLARVAALPVQPPTVAEWATPDESPDRRPGESPAVSPWAPPTPDQAAIVAPELPEPDAHRDTD